MEGEFDEAFFTSLDPLGLTERGKHGCGEALAIGLVAGDAVAFAAVHLGSFFEEGEGFLSVEVFGGAVFVAGGVFEARGETRASSGAGVPLSF